MCSDPFAAQRKCVKKKEIRSSLTVHHHTYGELLDVGAVRLHAGEGALVAQLGGRQEQAEVVRHAHAVLVVVGGADAHVLVPPLDQQVSRESVLFDLEGRGGGQSRGHPHTLPASGLLALRRRALLICRPCTQTGRGSDMTSGCQTGV